MIKLININNPLFYKWTVDKFLIYSNQNANVINNQIVQEGEFIEALYKKNV